MKFCRGGGLVSERKEDKGREMRALVTPARIISIAVFVLFSLLSYFAGRTWDQATIDLSKVQADVSELKQRKLDIDTYGFSKTEYDNASPNLFTETFF